MHAKEQRVSVLPIKDKVASVFSRFESSEQQDAHEFLMACLDIISDELSELQKQADDKENMQAEMPDSAIALPSDYQIEHQITCIECKAVKCATDVARDLPAHLPQEELDLPIPLESLLQATLMPERVEHICPECDCRHAEAATNIKQLPSLLIVHINRFGVEEGTAVKREQAISIPICLSPSSWGSAYNGFGTRAASGHYIFDKYDGTTREWTRFNDSVVRSISNETATTQHTKTAYVLAFVKRTK
eukprot:jgi/Hompol1/52/HPOL_005212-RA